MTNETKNSLLQTDGINIAETPNPYSASTITKLFEIRSPEPITFDKIPENNGNGFTIEFLDSETRYPIASKKVSRSLKQFETAFQNRLIPANTCLGNKTIKTAINGGGNYTECVFPSGSSNMIKIRNAQEYCSNSTNTIITGTCLGSINFVNATTETGNIINISDPTMNVDAKITQLEYNTKMSLYDMSNIIEISGMVNNIITSESNYEKVIVNMPGGCYYLYLMEAFQNGFINSELLLQYFDQVDIKEEKLTQSLLKRIKPNKSICIEVKSNLDQIFKNKMREFVVANESKKCLPDQILAYINNQIYLDVVKNSCLNGKVSYKDLIYSDYISIYLKEMKSSQNIVALENMAEETLYERTLEKAKQLRINCDRLTGIYILPKIVPTFTIENQNRNKNSLYFLPQNGGITISESKKIIQFYRNQQLCSQ